MIGLSDASRVRLSRLLGMLGSTFDGEVINAGRQADRLVKAAGLTWTDIIVAPPPGADNDPHAADWRRTATACLRFPMLINRWEFEFLSGLGRFPRISQKQRSRLENIVARLRAAGCAL
ncbi:MAG: hypothetical protein ACJ8AI_10625 [Rhodopila sp.]